MTVETLKQKEFLLTDDKGRRAFGSPEKILPKINKWLETSPVRVVSVESLFQNGCSGVGILTEFAGARVWYMSAIEQTEPQES